MCVANSGSRAPGFLLAFFQLSPNMHHNETGLALEPCPGTPQLLVRPTTGLAASPETALPLPTEASSADEVDRLPAAVRGAVQTFHDEVLAYVLSQMWYDLIFVHVLRLRPRPFCELWHLNPSLILSLCLNLCLRLRLYPSPSPCPCLCPSPSLSSRLSLSLNTSPSLNLSFQPQPQPQPASPPRLSRGGHRGGGRAPQARPAKVRRWRADYQVPGPGA